MRSRKTAFVALGLIIFLAALVFLYYSYNRQISAQEEARASIASAKTSLAKVSTDKTDWEKKLAQSKTQVSQLQDQLSQAKNKLVTYQTVLPTSVNNIDYNELLFQLAQNNKLTVNSINSSGASQEKIGSITFTKTAFALDVSGDIADVVRLIDTLTTDSHFANATMDNVNISSSTKETGEGDKKQTVTTTKLTINLILYSYAGS